MNFLSFEKNGELVIENLPVIDAIPFQMTQLFTNLLSNALKFSSDDRQLHMTVTTNMLTEQDVHTIPELKAGLVYWQIIFRDNGIGFSMEYKKQIFNIFQRLHGKSRYEGTGIGLALCKKIITNHEGFVYADSRPNEGATFFVILPETQRSSL